MTNFGTLAILGLPWMPHRQRYLLLALETVTAREAGWREIETGVLARLAGLSVNTAARARAELAKAGRIEYRPGTGPGHPGRYRLLFDVDKPPKNAGGVNPPKNAGGDKPPNVVGSVKPPKNTGGVNPPKQAPVSHPIEPQKPTTPNAVTSANASISLEPLTLDTSSLREAPHLNSRAEGTWSGQPDDDDFDYETRPRPGLGYGECTGCGEWHAIGISGRIGKRGRRGHYAPGAWGHTCPGVGQQPARPVRCAGCGQTGLALTAVEGLCYRCLRDRKEAEAAEGTP